MECLIELCCPIKLYKNIRKRKKVLSEDDDEIMTKTGSVTGSVSELFSRQCGLEVQLLLTVAYVEAQKLSYMPMRSVIMGILSYRCVFVQVFSCAYQHDTFRLSGHGRHGAVTLAKSCIEWYPSRTQGREVFYVIESRKD